MGSIEIIVTGQSTSVDEWARANRADENELPMLSNDQKSFARKFGLSEVDFARSVLAGRYGSEKRAAEASRFAGLLREAVVGLPGGSEIEIDQVVFSTFDRRFFCHLREGSREFSFEIGSSFVADHLDSGDHKLRESLKQVLAERVEQARRQSVGAGR